MSFKVGDFLQAPGFRPAYVEAIKGKEQKLIMLDDGSTSNFYNHNWYQLHPTFGIEPTDVITDSSQNIYSNIKLTTSFYPFRLSCNNMHYDFSSQQLANFSSSNPHWNTCAQHYKTHVLGQQCPVVQTISTTTANAKFSIGDTIYNPTSSASYFYKVYDFDFVHGYYVLQNIVTNIRFVERQKTVEQDYVYMPSSATTQSTPNLSPLPLGATFSPTKFQVGDKIESIYGVTGQILNVDILANEYEVHFDGPLRPVTRPIHQIDQDYNFLSNATSHAIKGGQVKLGGEEGVWYIPDNRTPTCNHNFTEYNGLVESYFFCTLCDTKKPKES